MPIGLFILKPATYEWYEKETKREVLNVNKRSLCWLYKQNIVTSMAEDFPVTQTNQKPNISVLLNDWPQRISSWLGHSESTLKPSPTFHLFIFPKYAFSHLQFLNESLISRSRKGGAMYDMFFIFDLLNTWTLHFQHPSHT